MKKIIIILGFIAAILAVILAVTPLFKLAVFPIFIAFISGLSIIYLSKKEGVKTKTIQYIFLLIIIALGLTIYKAVFTEAKVGNVEELEQREEKSEEDSIELLEDIEIED
jgi:membrane protein implicated in regulation of membrane protease activity